MQNEPETCHAIMGDSVAYIGCIQLTCIVLLGCMTCPGHVDHNAEGQLDHQHLFAGRTVTFKTLSTSVGFSKKALPTEATLMELGIEKDDAYYSRIMFDPKTLDQLT